MDQLPFKIITNIAYIQLLLPTNGGYTSTWHDSNRNDRTNDQYTDIWYDPMDEKQNNDWTPTPSKSVAFAYSSSGCFNNLCTRTDAMDGSNSYVLRNTDISGYSSLEIQFDVSLVEMEAGDTCKVYYAYDSTSAKTVLATIDPPDDEQRHLYPEQFHTLPSSISKSTVYIWLESDSSDGSGNDICYWDNVYLRGILGAIEPTEPIQPPTTPPTQKPTPQPTNNPSPQPIVNTPSPTEPTHTPTSTPISDTPTPTNAPTDNPTFAPTDTPSNPTELPTPTPNVEGVDTLTPFPQDTPIPTDTSSPTAPPTEETSGALNDDNDEEQDEEKEEPSVVNIGDTDAIVISKYMLVLFIIIVIAIGCLGAYLTYIIYKIICRKKRKKRKKSEVMIRGPGYSASVASNAISSNMQSDINSNSAVSTHVQGEGNVGEGVMAVLQGEKERQSVIGAEGNEATIQMVHIKEKKQTNDGVAKTGTCMGCGQIDEGKIFEDDGLFYCNECWRAYNEVIENADRDGDGDDLFGSYKTRKQSISDLFGTYPKKDTKIVSNT